MLVAIYWKVYFFFFMALLLLWHGTKNKKKKIEVFSIRNYNQIGYTFMFQLSWNSKYHFKV